MTYEQLYGCVLFFASEYHVKSMSARLTEPEGKLTLTVDATARGQVEVCYALRAVLPVNIWVEVRHE